MQVKKIRETKNFGETKSTIVQFELSEAEADRLIVYLQDMRALQRSVADSVKKYPVAVELLDALENCV